MNAAKQTFYLFSTLIALASSFWFFSSSAPKFKLNAKTLLETTDTVITNLNVRQYSKTGTLSHSLQTPLVRHIPKNNTHLILKPHIFIARPAQPSWEINAAEATALYGGEEITFKHDVRIHQKKGDHNDESTITTEEITYFPKTQMATTAKGTNHIELDQGTTHLRAASATTNTNLKNQLINAIAKGNESEQAHFWTTTDGHKPPLHAYANTISYFPEKHLIYLTGNARVSQGNDSYSAPTIHYDTLHQHVISKAEKKRQTVIIIHPNGALNIEHDKL